MDVNAICGGVCVCVVMVPEPAQNRVHPGFVSKEFRVS